MTDELDVNKAYRTNLVDGLYSKHQSNKNFLLAKIHQHLEYPEITDVDALDDAIRKLAQENQVLFLLNSMFGGDETTKESAPE